MNISELKNIGRKKIKFIITCLIWSIVIVTATLINLLIQYLCILKISDLVRNPDFFIPTQFVWYNKSLWAIIWTIKFISCFQIYYKNNSFSHYKKTFLPDLLICLLFIIEYMISYYIYILSSHKFKISGHSLILTMTSSMIMYESDYNYRVTKKPYIKSVFYIIFSINLYTFYWSALAFHSFLEISLGTGLGLTSVYLVYIKYYYN